MAYSEEDLKNAVSISTSIRQVLIKLNRAPSGGNFKIVKSKIRKYKIDNTHFTGSSWRKGNTYSTSRKKLEEILVKKSVYKSGSPYQSNKVKGFLFKNGLSLLPSTNTDYNSIPQEIWQDEDVVRAIEQNVAP